jgi:tetratricopeptide (TPR) repeat protein
MSERTLSDVMGWCWSNHEANLGEVVAEIEAAAPRVRETKDAAAFTALVNHAIGQHAGAWPKAAALDSRVLQQVEASAAAASGFGNLAVARAMSGEGLQAFEAETRAAALAGENAVAQVVRVRFLLVEALAAARRWDEALALLPSVLDMAGALPAGSPAERVAAMSCNNIASALIDHPERRPEWNAALERTALASRQAWLRCGDWMNDERSDYLLALAYDALGRHDEALACASRGLETIARNGEEPYDAAFLHVARAKAHHAMGDGSSATTELAKAKALRPQLDADWQARLDADMARVRT